MPLCTIASIPIKLLGIPETQWELFLNSPSTDIHRVRIGLSASEERALPFIVAAHSGLIVHHLPGSSWLYKTPPHLPPVEVSVSSDYSDIRWHLPEYHDEAAQREKLNHLLRTALECRFCHEGVVSLHAACVEKDGEAVAFTGASGMGKSTRARAWEQALGAQLISGDRPAVRLSKQGNIACGVPWDGKEQVFRNVERPLKAIIEVRRSPANYLRRLTVQQAIALLAQQSFVPMWDTDCAAMAMANIWRLASSTPVYRVFCGPDAEDAQMIYDILYHHPEQIREEAEQMKIKEGFVLRTVVDEYIVMPTGDNIARFDGAVALNEVSAFVYRRLENPVSRDDLLTALLGEYDVDESTAAADLDALLEKFEQMGILEK